MTSFWLMKISLDFKLSDFPMVIADFGREVILDFLTLSGQISRLLLLTLIDQTLIFLQAMIP